MRHSWHIRSTAILVMALFAQATLVVPGLEAAGLMGAGQRFGVDQDGNVVQLSAPAPVVDPSPRTIPLANVPAPPLPTIRYVMDQNGAIREAARADVTAVPVPATPAVALETAPAAQPASAAVAHAAPAPAVAPAIAQPASKTTSPGIFTAIATRVKSFLAGATRGSSTAVATAGPPPVAPKAASIRVPTAVTLNPERRSPILPKPGTVAVSHVAPLAPTHAKVVRSGSPASTAGPHYSLEIDSLKVPASARPVEKKLENSGIAILDTKTAPASVGIHRLVIATFPTLEKARKRLHEVQRKLPKAYIISQNGVHGVYCGSYYQVRKAAAKATQLRTAGVRFTIRRETVTVNRTTIIAGVYLSRSAARDISLRLRQMGIPATIVESSETMAELRNGTRKWKAV